MEDGSRLVELKLIENHTTTRSELQVLEDRITQTKVSEALPSGKTGIT